MLRYYLNLTQKMTRLAMKSKALISQEIQQKQKSLGEKTTGPEPFRAVSPKVASFLTSYVVGELPEIRPTHFQV